MTENIGISDKLPMQAGRELKGDLNGFVVWQGTKLQLHHSQPP